MENYVHSLSRELVEMGHEVTVLCANEPKSKKDDVIDGIKVRRLPYIGKIANTNITPQLPLEILRDDFDIIHTHLPTPWSADWSAVVATVKRRPLVLTYCNDIVGDGRAKKIAQLYNHFNLKYLLKKASKTIIIQPNYLNTSLHLERYEKKVVAIPVGVDLERFKPLGTSTNGNTLFFLSVLDRFHRYKGLDYLLFALSMVAKEVPDVKLIVGGDGDLLGHYQRLSDSLNLGKCVEFLGYVPEEKVAYYYNRCDIFVLPSISTAQEGFGMVLLEAMACGKPVVCTEIVGVAAEVTKEGAGITVEPSNADELAKAISHILQNRSEALKMGKASRRLVEEKYGWKQVEKRVEEIYKEVNYPPLK